MTRTSGRLSLVRSSAIVRPALRTRASRRACDGPPRICGGRVAADRQRPGAEELSGVSPDYRGIAVADPSKSGRPRLERRAPNSRSGLVRRGVRQRMAANTPGTRRPDFGWARPPKTETGIETGRLDVYATPSGPICPNGVSAGQSLFEVSGGCGIRTREGLHPTRFPSERHRPLGESSARNLTGTGQKGRTEPGSSFATVEVDRPQPTSASNAVSNPPPAAFDEEEARRGQRWESGVRLARLVACEPAASSVTVRPFRGKAVASVPFQPG